MNIQVQWFNNLKGYGEGLTAKGDKVFLHYTAMKPDGRFHTLTPGEEVVCQVEKEGDNLIATHIRRIGQ